MSIGMRHCACANGCRARARSIFRITVRAPRYTLSAYIYKGQRGALNMSVQRQSVPSTDEDLDSTAELPVLEVADLATEHVASTDTWIIPSGLAALTAAPA